MEIRSSERVQLIYGHIGWSWERVVGLAQSDCCSYKREKSRTSLVVQWLRVRLPIQGTWVQSWFRKIPTCHGAAEPVCHNYRSTTSKAAATRSLSTIARESLCAATKAQRSQKSRMHCFLKGEIETQTHTRHVCEGGRHVKSLADTFYEPRNTTASKPLEVRGTRNSNF